MSTIGRNDLCPCGSGKKYKKCCLPKEEALPRPAPALAPEEPLAEELFTAEIHPELDDRIERFLERLEAGEGESLKAEAEKLLRKAPNYYLTNHVMGVYLVMVEEDPAGAIPFFEKAVRLFPLFAQGHYNLASAYLQDAQISKAVAALRKSIKYAADDDEVANLANEKLAWLEKTLLRTTPFTSIDAYLENERLFDSAYENLRQNRFQQAIDLFKQVLQQYPKHVQSYGNMALAYAGLGQKAVALECLDKALAIDRSYLPALTNRIAIEAMTEGEPQRDVAIAETQYYREVLANKNNPRHSWWEKIKESLQR
jgi:tetratricopeptide (TPR) repeat protein